MILDHKIDLRNVQDVERLALMVLFRHCIITAEEGKLSKEDTLKLFEYMWDTCMKEQKP